MSTYDQISRINDTFHLRSTGCGCCAEETTWPNPWGEKVDRRANLLVDLAELELHLREQLVTIEEMRARLK